MSVVVHGIAPAIFTHREEILRICAKHGCGNVRVFGSFARGDAQPESDLDLLVDIVGPLTLWWPGGPVVELEELLGRTVEIVTEEGISPRFKPTVLAEAIQL